MLTDRPHKGFGEIFAPFSEIVTRVVWKKYSEISTAWNPIAIYAH